MQVTLIETPQGMSQCFEVFQELRPHLKNLDQFINQILTQQREGYTLEAIYVDEQVVGCIGYRVMNMLAWGKVLYLDDLVVKQASRGKGYGGKLLGHVIEVAQLRNCKQVHLDTGFTRHDAHKLYLRHKFQLNCHHMALLLK